MIEVSMVFLFVVVTLAAATSGSYNSGKKVGREELRKEAVSCIERYQTADSAVICINLKALLDD